MDVFVENQICQEMKNLGSENGRKVCTVVQYLRYSLNRRISVVYG